MAAFDPIPLFGIGFDRDVTILLEEDSSRRDSPCPSVISLSLGVDEPWVTRLPLFSLATSQVSALRLLSPTSLPINPLLEDRCLQPGTAPSGLLGGKSRYCAFDDDCAGSDLSDTLPLDRFAKTSQRHEQIALALAGTDSRCHLPYQDYVPCPGSGPGSPAVSIATDYIPPAAPVFVEQSRPDLPPSMTLAGITSAPPPVSVNSPLTRYLEDTSQTHEWLAVVLEQDATLDSGPADAQETTPTRQDTPTSSITLDGDGSMFGGFHLAMPAEGLTSSTTRRREDGDEEEYTTEDNAKTLQALSHIRVQREVRIAANGYCRWKRPIRMRQSDSPPHKRARTGDPET